MHTHTHIKLTQKLERPGCRNRKREIWRRALRSNRQVGNCLSSATGTINCTWVNCLPMMCANAPYIPSSFSNSLGGLLRAQTLTSHSESGRGRNILWESDFPVVIQEHEFSPIFNLFVVTVWFREQWGGCFCIFRSGSLIHSWYKELRPQRLWLMRKTISQQNSQKQSK